MEKHKTNDNGIMQIAMHLHTINQYRQFKNRSDQPPKSKDASSKGQLAHLQPLDAKNLMNQVYNDMIFQWKQGNIRPPANFINFHQMEICLKLTRAVIAYIIAHLKVQEVKVKIKHNSSDMDFYPLQYNTKTIESKIPNNLLVIESPEKTRQTCLTALSQAYARLVLNCSNYEKHKDDERFFEAVYQFLTKVAQLSVPKASWKDVEIELCYIFRGPMFGKNLSNGNKNAFQYNNKASQNQLQTHTAFYRNTTSKDTNIDLNLPDTSQVGKNENNTWYRNRAVCSRSNLRSNACSDITSLSNGGSGMLKDPGTKRGSNISLTSTTKGVFGGNSLPKSSNAFPNHTESPTEPIKPLIFFRNANQSPVSHIPPSISINRLINQFDSTNARAKHNILVAQKFRGNLQAIQVDSDHITKTQSPNENSNNDCRHIADSDEKMRLRTSVTEASSHSKSPRIVSKASLDSRSPAINLLLSTALDHTQQYLESHENLTQGVTKLSSCRPPETIKRK